MYNETAGASSNKQAGMPPKSSSITNAIADFDPCIDRASKFAAHLQNLCERLVGPRPAEVGKGMGVDHPSPLIGSIHERRSRLAAILDDMERSLQNLDSAI